MMVLTKVAISIADVGERRKNTIKEGVLRPLGSLSSSLLRGEHVIIAPDVEQISRGCGRIGELPEARSHRPDDHNSKITD